MNIHPKFTSARIAIALGVALGSSTALPLDASPHPGITASLNDLIPAGKRVNAPGFSLPGIDGQTINLSNQQGKVVLLDFWAINCGGCKVELPWYVEFDTRYKSKGLALIGLDMYGEDPSVIKPFAAKWKMTYPLAVGTDAIGDLYGLKEMPLTVLIDRKGRIAFSHSGIVDKASFEQAIATLLNE